MVYNGYKKFRQDAGFSNSENDSESEASDSSPDFAGKKEIKEEYELIYGQIPKGINEDDSDVLVVKKILETLEKLWLKNDFLRGKLGLPKNKKRELEQKDEDLSDSDDGIPEENPMVDRLSEIIALRKENQKLAAKLIHKDNSKIKLK